jgi:cytochrome c biogenesis protein CcdA
MENLLKGLIESGGILAFMGAFLGGLLTALNPCVLAMVPLIVGFVGGQKELTTRKAALYTGVFVFGFCLELALIFTLMSGLAPYLKGAWMNYVIAGICIAMGLFFLDVFQIPALVSQEKLPKTTGYLGALLFGFMYGLISLPCTGPALLLILSLIPVKGAAFGGGLLVFYGLGNCTLLIVAGTSIGAVRGIIDSKGAQRTIVIVRKVAAVLIILMGIYFIYQA